MILSGIVEALFLFSTLNPFFWGTPRDPHFSIITPYQWFYIKNQKCASTVPIRIIQKASTRNFMEIGLVVISDEYPGMKNGCASCNRSQPVCILLRLYSLLLLFDLLVLLLDPDNSALSGSFSFFVKSAKLDGRKHKRTHAHTRTRTQRHAHALTYARRQQERKRERKKPMKKAGKKVSNKERNHLKKWERKKARKKA